MTIEVGARVTATGQLQDDGTVLALIVDVNVRQVRGAVVAVLPDGPWTVEETVGSSGESKSGRTVRVLFDDARPPVGPDGDVLVFRQLATAEGRQVAVIGVSISDTSIRGTRLIHW